MKKYALNEITVLQYIFMIHATQLGFGLLSLPADLAMYAGTDGWISLLIGWALAVLASLFIVQVMKKHQDDTIYDLIPRYFGKVLGFILNSCMIVFFMFGFFVSFLSAVGFFKLELLANTPNFLLVLLFALPTYQLARNNVRILARYAEITFWSFLWILLIILYPLKESHWLYLLPVLKEGWGPVLKAANPTGLSFLGFEISFILYPFLKHKEKAAMGIIAGNTITLVIYMIVILICFLFFSPDDITSYKYPTLKVLKIIEFRFMERIEIIVLVAYLFLIFRVWTHYLYASTFGISRLLGKQDHKPFVRLAIIGMLILSTFYRPSSSEFVSMLKLFGNAGWYFAFALPLILLAYTSVFKPRGGLQ
ncbi:GerAB/ArcD/ProY family transporter [Paenibacillus lignilyticus]|uniref:Endospore germination permease n=1 Tax=Paenibacillus lignilyticus TaxID=1172615 RepID=A0ABS5CCR8_9BACL|nr:endospore germination permease [Paenibacillus lignilyticus]MBP3961542.1 endospore germination permease [Paenibacillus lignilyticus]MBP3963788.1 endospore germination permease [Paenibacillus lignilyticus]